MRLSAPCRLTGPAETEVHKSIRAVEITGVSMDQQRMAVR